MPVKPPAGRGRTGSSASTISLLIQANCTALDSDTTDSQNHFKRPSRAAISRPEAHPP